MSLIQSQRQARSSGSLPFLLGELGKTSSATDKKFDDIVSNEISQEAAPSVSCKGESSTDYTQSAPSKNKDEEVETVKSEKLNSNDCEENVEDKNTQSSQAVSSAQKEEKTEEKVKEEGQKDEKPVSCELNTKDENNDAMSADSLYAYMTLQNILPQQTTLVATPVVEEMVVEGSENIKTTELETETMPEAVYENISALVAVKEEISQSHISLPAQALLVESPQAVPSSDLLEDENLYVAQEGVIVPYEQQEEAPVLENAEPEIDNLNNEVSDDVNITQSVDTAKLKLKPQLEVAGTQNSFDINFNTMIQWEAALPQDTRRNLGAILEQKIAPQTQEIKIPQLSGLTTLAPKPMGALANIRSTVPTLKLLTINAESLQNQIRETLGSELKLQKDKIEIRLDPPEWGKIHVKIETQESGMKVSFFSDNPLVREALEKHMQDLRNMLNQDGLNFSSLNVGVQEHAAQGREQGDDAQNQANFEDVELSTEENGGIQARQRLKTSSVVDHVV
ncbi:flagellar hook-length control protein FliK [bacterium]|nr:flagellar hook-length control protein FliK [bacterium]